MGAGGQPLLREGNADGEVRMVGAEIGGNLEFDHSTFKNGLLADGINVGRNLFLLAGFSAEGEVRLTGVEIGGPLCAITHRSGTRSELRSKLAESRRTVLCFCASASMPRAKSD